MSHEEKRQRNSNAGIDSLPLTSRAAVTLAKHRLDGGTVGGGEFPDAARHPMRSVPSERPRLRTRMALVW